MKYSFSAVIEVDTSSNKITVLEQPAIVGGSVKRVVLFPSSKRTADWVDITINDRPMKPINTAKNLCRAVVQAFLPKPRPTDYTPSPV